jgi:biopolymer transport protein ExbD
MNRILEVCLVALTLAASIPSSAAKPVAVAQNSSFAGTWEGSRNGIPGISLKIQEADRNVTGNVVFCFQQRADTNTPWHVAGESAVPLLAPHIEGKTLTFEVEHHKCRGCAELGPNVKFRMALAGANEARLWDVNEPLDSGQGLKLVRVSEASASTAQALQRGISVKMPTTRSAAPMPDADNQDAWIVSVTADGNVDFGVDPVTPAALADDMKSQPRNREQKLYIKADARVPFADVEKVLAAGRTALFEAPVLLTSQPESPQPGAVVSPKGLEVLFVSPAGSQPVEVQVIVDSAQRTPILKVNNRQIPWTNLQSMVMQIFQNRPEKVVRVKADGQLPFAEIVHVIDVCHSAGAKIVLAISER